MSSRDALILFLAEVDARPPRWMRVVDGSVVQSGEGANWLAVCGMTQLPAGTRVMIVPPAALVTLHWIAHPDLAPRQGAAAARLSALSASLLPADQMFAAAAANDDPARAHMVALASRADLQHWLLAAQHHGLDPDLIVPAALLVPEPDSGFHRAQVGGEAVWRGRDVAFPADMALPELIGDATVVDVPDAAIERAAVAALDAPPLDLRQGDFAKRVRREIDPAAIRRIALLGAIIFAVVLATSIVGLLRHYREIARLDAQSVELARQILPAATDAQAAQAELEAQLAARGSGARAFTAPLSGLLSALQDAPGVALTALSRDPDGMVRATLAAARAEDINIVLLALQAAGFTITATPAQDPGGRTLADITVRS